MPGVLLGRGRDLLGDSDERNGERHFEDRESPLLRRLEERVVQRGHVQLRGERQSGYPGVVQPLQIGALSGRGTGIARPAVMITSAPRSQGVGSASSLACAQDTDRFRPPLPAFTESWSAGKESRSPTVSLLLAT